MFTGKASGRYVMMFVTGIVSAGLVGCAPKSFVKMRASESDWRVVEFRPDMDRDHAWYGLADTISLEHDIEFLDKDAGYIRTGWMFSLYPTHKQRYRTRVVAKIPPTNDKVRIKTDAQWMPLGARYWTVGYDTAELEDIWGDLQGTIGRVRR